MLYFCVRKMFKGACILMKKAIKRVMSLILCAALLISTAAIGASAEDGETDCEGNCGHSPVVILPGINHSPTYVYDENDNPVLDSDGNHIGGTLLMINLDGILSDCLAKVVVSLLATIVTQHSIGIYDVAYETACTAFSYQKVNDEGNHVENLKTQRFYSLEEMTEDDLEWAYRMIPMKPLVDEIGEDHVYFYTFNLVGDPMKSADELDAYIDLVRERTGHDKVTLLPVSLGGTILTSYLDAYGHDKVDAIVNAVACLNGTDIVADMLAREWNLKDEYFYHEYLANVLEANADSATLGYLINIVLHIIPSKGVDDLLSGAISGVLDTIMINCPQIWAMIPSYRYDALAERYLTEKPVLKAKTDRFQQARLNLEDNILAAVEDGVKVNFISGSNLNFSDGEYNFFGIVASDGKVNSDGIINLSSTTLGAKGAVPGETLPEGYKQFYTNPEYPDYSYISPDRTIDASTALLPDNTWIFLDQHHEVGNNDVVLNLAKAIILGEVTDVHDNPEVHPQFNYTCNTKYIRRWRIPDAKHVLETYDNLSAEDRAELEAAIADGEAVVNATIADAEKTQAAEERLNNILIKVGYMEPEEEPSAIDGILETVMEKISWGLVKLLGGGSLYDAIFHRNYRR